MKLIHVLLCMLAVALISSCIEDSDNSVDASIDEYYDSLIPVKANAETLARVPALKLELALKNGVRMRALEARDKVLEPDEGPPKLSRLLYSVDCSSRIDSFCYNSSSSSGGSATYGVRFDYTNQAQQDQGVESGDISAYDGSYLYDLTNQRNGVNIFSTSPDSLDVSYVNFMDSNDSRLSDVYLCSNNTAVKNYAIVIGAATSNTIQILDVTTPESPSLDWTMSFTGKIKGSRKVGDTLYLVSQHAVESGDDAFGWREEDTLGSFDSRLEEHGLSDLVASYAVGSGPQTPLAEECLTHETLNEHQGYISTYNLTAINLIDHKVTSLCVTGNLDEFIITSSNIYTSSTFIDDSNEHLNTEIHKFALNNGQPTYQATGSVFGYLSAGTPRGVKWHATGDDLRLIATDEGTNHTLLVLEQHDNALVTVGELAVPMSSDIYSVRFDDNRVYLSNYYSNFKKATQYVILNLDEKTQPKVLRTVDFPNGASSPYNYSINDQTIFSIYDEENANGDRISKAELYDISGDQPVITDSFTFGPTKYYSRQFSSDIKTISYIKKGADQLRISFLATLRYDDATLNGNFEFGLKMFEINGLSSGNARLTDLGILAVEDSSSGLTEPHGGYPSSAARTYFNDDQVIINHFDGLWSANWGEPASLVGPTVKTP